MSISAAACTGASSPETTSRLGSGHAVAVEDVALAIDDGVLLVMLPDCHRSPFGQVDHHGVGQHPFHCDAADPGQGQHLFARRLQIDCENRIAEIHVQGINQRVAGVSCRPTTRISLTVKPVTCARCKVNASVAACTRSWIGEFLPRTAAAATTVANVSTPAVTISLRRLKNRPADALAACALPGYVRISSVALRVIHHPGNELREGDPGVFRLLWHQRGGCQAIRN